MMRSLKWELLFATGLPTLLVSAPAFAAHSWCVTGAPLTLAGSTDATTSAVISNVCSKPDFGTCCTSRWGLACVQTGADYARQNNLSGGDFCGRYQWAQGPLPGTQQAYPRDFNLFATSGSVSTLRDSDGPIAAAGSLGISYFNLNLKRKESVAVVAQGSAILHSGTINGSFIYGSTYSDTVTTYIGASRPTAKTVPFPIDFSKVTTNLIAMSQALQRYDAVPATKVNSNVTFTGTDPELNVFTIAAASLSGTTSYTYNVPAGSNVIINVSGTNPTISNAGFSGNAHPARLLWNFPDATSLTLQSVGFYGSVLAPKATGNFTNGSFAGTAVVAAGSPANVELYSVPYQVPSCTGGLCMDSGWSVSGDTAIDDSANAVGIKEEAGFLEIPSEAYVGEGQPRKSPKHRVWYSFQPASIEPKNKPLAIFFNGGPGSATTSFLFAFNTGSFTLDPQITGTGKKIVASALANNWTQFANLLYIDQPATGFSYPLSEGGVKPDIGTDMDRDAGIFVSVLLRFLKRHPTLQSNRVVIVGESYGGVRATKMLHHIYQWSSLTNAASAYQDSQLANDLQKYFSNVLGTSSPSAPQIASKFGHQVLIEPVLVGEKQHGASDSTSAAFNPSVCISPTCMTTSPSTPATCDAYNCDKPPTYSDDLALKASTNLTDVTVLSTALGVDVKTIEWMKASSRTNAYGRNDGDIVPPVNLTSVFGTLNPEDSYLMMSNNVVLDGYTGASQWFTKGQGVLGAVDYATHLRNNVSTFLTVTKFDTVVYTPDIPYAMNGLLGDPSFGGFVSGMGYSSSWVTGLPRPGIMRVSYFPATDFRDVIMPHTYASGHTVTMRAPGELLADVTQWYSTTPH